MICSDGTSEKVGKLAKKNESKETEETPVVEIHINCPASKVDSRQPQVELKQDSETGYTGPSAEARDVESGEQSLSDMSLVRLSEDDCDVGHLQDLEEVGESCPPRNVTVTGLVQQNDFRGCGLAPVENPACCSSWNENLLQPQGNSNGEFSNWAMAMERPGSSGSSGLHMASKILLPLPRPSLWQQVYSKTLKKRERQVEQNLWRKMQGRPKKEAVSLEEAMRARSIPIIWKKAKKSMRLKVDQDSNYGPAVLPPDEAIVGMFGVDVKGCRGSSSDKSSSDASSRLTSALSCYSSVSSDRDLEKESLENADNGQEGGRKPRKWLARNKVAPL